MQQSFEVNIQFARFLKARRQYNCRGCGLKIQKGDHYLTFICNYQPAPVVGPKECMMADEPWHEEPELVINFRFHGWECAERLGNRIIFFVSSSAKYFTSRGIRKIFEQEGEGLGRYLNCSG